jgi:hypothetical protein
MAFQDLRGQVGDKVVARTDHGLVVKRLPRYKRPISAKLAASSQRLKRAGELWVGLALPQVEAWRAYAAGLTRRDDVTGEEYSPTAKNAFAALAVKVLQVDPEAPVPTSPPAGPFLGDSVELAVSAAPAGARFEASGPNGPDVTTELFAQPLANVRRLPGKRYVSEGFHRFLPGSLSVVAPLAPGAWALAARFVRPSTGQATGLRRLGVVEVVV